MNCLETIFIITIITALMTFIGVAVAIAADRQSRRVMDGRELEKTHWTAYEQGRYACRECKGPNPYPVGSVPFKSWNKGWLDQLEGVKPE